MVHQIGLKSNIYFVHSSVYYLRKLDRSSRNSFVIQHGLKDEEYVNIEWNFSNEM